MFILSFSAKNYCNHIHVLNQYRCWQYSMWGSITNSVQVLSSFFHSITLKTSRAKHTLQHLTFHHLQTSKDFFVKMLIVTPSLNLCWNTKCFNFICRGSFILNPRVLRVFVLDMCVAFFEGNFQPKNFQDE